MLEKLKLFNSSSSKEKAKSASKAKIGSATGFESPTSPQLQQLAQSQTPTSTAEILDKSGVDKLHESAEKKTSKTTVTSRISPGSDERRKGLPSPVVPHVTGRRGGNRPSSFATPSRTQSSKIICSVSAGGVASTVNSSSVAPRKQVTPTTVQTGLKTEPVPIRTSSQTGAAATETSAVAKQRPVVGQSPASAVKGSRIKAPSSSSVRVAPRVEARTSSSPTTPGSQGLVAFPGSTLYSGGSKSADCNSSGLYKDDYSMPAGSNVPMSSSASRQTTPGGPGANNTNGKKPTSGEDTRNMPRSNSKLQVGGTSSQVPSSGGTRATSSRGSVRDSSGTAQQRRSPQQHSSPTDPAPSAPRQSGSASAHSSASCSTAKSVQDKSNRYYQDRVSSFKPEGVLGGGTPAMQQQAYPQTSGPSQQSVHSSSSEVLSKSRSIAPQPSSQVSDSRPKKMDSDTQTSASVMQSMHLKKQQAATTMRALGDQSSTHPRLQNDQAPSRGVPTSGASGDQLLDLRQQNSMSSLTRTASQVLETYNDKM